MTTGKQLVPAAPTNMIPWILHVLEDGPFKLSELCGKVGPLAQSEGFQIRDLHFLKKALAKLKKNSLVINLRKSWWALPPGNRVNEIATPADLFMGKRSMRVLREIGTGLEYVYVLQFHDDVQRARDAGLNGWTCKIGMSKNATQRLLSNVSNTYIAQSPEIGLMILCDDAVNVEKTLHHTLRACNQKIKDSVGHELFHTSPDHIADFYSEWVKSCAKLKLASGI